MYWSVQGPAPTRETTNLLPTFVACIGAFTAAFSIFTNMGRKQRDFSVTLVFIVNWNFFTAS